MKPVSPVATQQQIEAVGLDFTKAEELVLAKDQPEYIPLPVLRFVDDFRFGMAVCRYRLTWRERIRLLLTGNLFLSQLTFGKGFAPVRPATTFSELYEEVK